MWHGRPIYRIVGDAMVQLLGTLWPEDRLPIQIQMPLGTFPP